MSVSLDSHVLSEVALVTDVKMLPQSGRNLFREQHPVREVSVGAGVPPSLSPARVRRDPVRQPWHFRREAPSRRPNPAGTAQSVGNSGTARIDTPFALARELARGSNP
jgi:hypothetical protein